MTLGGVLVADYQRSVLSAVGLPRRKWRMRKASALVMAWLLVVSLVAPTALLGVASAAGNTTIVVTADGSGDHQTIQAGVDNANDGDTVEVESGVYNETVTVDKNITLIAPNGATLNGSLFGTDSTGVYVDRNVSTGLTIDGFTVESYGDGISVGASTNEGSDDSYEFDGTAGGWVIQNVVVRNNAQDGIDVAGTTTAAWTIDNVTATSNGDEGLEIGYEVNGVDPNQDWIVSNVNASKNGEYGIRVGYEQGAWTIENTTTNDNGDSSESGVQVYQSGSNWSIIDHTATGNDRSGISVPSGDAGLIERANLSENRNFGFEAGTEGDWTLRDSLVLNNDEDGVYDSDTASSFLVDNVTIRGNGHDGVFLLYNSGDWQILNSVIENNGATDFADPPGAGIDAEWTSGLWVVNNTSITGNEDAGIYAENAQNTGDATENWWGQASGPASGQCVGNVDCSLYLTSDPGASGPTTAGVEGTLTNASGAQLSGINVTVYRDDGSSFAQAGTNTTTATGTYSIDGIDASDGSADLKLEFAANSTDYATEWYDNAETEAGATVVTVSAGTTANNLDAQLTKTALPVVEGTMTNQSGNSLSGINVTVYRDDGTGQFLEYETNTTDSNGDYSIEVEPRSSLDDTVDMQLRFSDPTGTYLTEWYDDTDQSGAKTVTLKRGFRTTLLGTSLAEDAPGIVEGTARNESSDPLSGIEVTVYRNDGTGQFLKYDTVTTDANGDYSVEVEPLSSTDDTVDVKVRFSDPSGTYLTEWYDDTDQSGAKTLTLTRGFRKILLGTKLAEDVPGVVEGTVRDQNNDPLSDIEVTVYRDDGAGQFVEYATATSDSSGDYSIEVEPRSQFDDTVDVKVRFSDPSGTYLTEWHADTDRPGAETLTLTRGSRKILLGTTLNKNTASGGSSGGSSSSSDSDPEPVTFSGRVTDDNGDPIEGISVSGFRDGGNGAFVGVKSETTNANGRYTVQVEPPAGEDSVRVRLRFTDWNWTYAQRWYDARTVADAVTFTVPEGGSRVNLDTTMEENVVTVAGVARNTDGDPLDNIRVAVYRRGDDGQFRSISRARTYTDEFGEYESAVAVPELETEADLKVRFWDPDTEYATTYWRNATTLRDAEVINATAGSEHAAVNVTMPEWDAVGVRYGGTVSNETSHLEDVRVTIYRDDGTGTFRAWTSRRTDEAGFWEAWVRPPDGAETVSAKIRYRDETGRHLEEWETDQPSQQTATDIDVSVGDFALFYGTELELAPTTLISGVVYNESNEALNDIEVTLYRKEGPGPSNVFATAMTDSNGYYAFRVPALPGESTVETRLHFDDPTGEYARAWYLDKYRRANATVQTNPAGSHDRLNVQTLRTAGMLLGVWVQPLSTCQDPGDEDSCTFPDRADTATVGPDETVAVRYVLWNGDDRVYRDYDVDDPATSTTMFGAGHRIVPGEFRWQTETLTAPIVDGTYDYQATATSDNRNGVVSNSTASYTIEVSGSIVQQARTPDGFSASVSGSGSGEPVLVGGNDGVATANGTTMQSLLLRTEGGDYTLNVTGSESAPNGTAPLSLPPGGTAFSYFTVDHSVPDSEIENVTFRFRIDQVALSNTSTQPTNVTLYRYVDGSPMPLPSSLVRETSTAVIYEATSPGLSVFAVGTTRLADDPPTEETTTTDRADTAHGISEREGLGFAFSLFALALLVAALLVYRQKRR